MRPHNCNKYNNRGHFVLGGIMDKIYIATSGDYSDLAIIGVFSSEENAELVRGNDYGVSIQEYELDEFVDLAQKGYTPFHVILNYDTGDVIAIEDGNWGMNFLYVSRHWSKGNPKVIHTSVIAKSKEGAIKITNEKLAQIKAKEMV